VYENAMRIELKKMGIYIEQQKNIKVYYECEQVGDYYAEILANNLVIMN
jgi:GxxExxY protein